jgi:hypothetical protein
MRLARLQGADTFQLTKPFVGSKEFRSLPLRRRTRYSPTRGIGIGLKPKISSPIGQGKRPCDCLFGVTSTESRLFSQVAAVTFAYEQLKSAWSWTAVWLWFHGVEKSPP